MTAHATVWEATDPRFPAVVGIVERDNRYDVQVRQEPQSNGGCETSLISGQLDLHRQAMESVARLHLGVRDRDHFVLRSVLFRRVQSGPYSHDLRVQVPKSFIRARTLDICSTIRGEMSTWSDDVQLAVGGGKGAFFSSKAFESCRDTSENRHWGLPLVPGTPQTTEPLGLDQGDILISAVRYSSDAAYSDVCLDEAQRYFDRPLDHYPGLMLAGAARQLAVLSAAQLAASRASRIEILAEAHQFRAFVELTSAPSLRAQVIGSTAGEVRVRVDVLQHGTIRADCLFTLHRGRPEPTG